MQLVLGRWRGQLVGGMAGSCACWGHTVAQSVRQQAAASAHWPPFSRRCTAEAFVLCLTSACSAAGSLAAFLARAFILAACVQPALVSRQ